MNRWTNGWIDDGWMDGWEDRWKDGWIVRQTDGVDVKMNECIDRWRMDIQTGIDRWMEGWID